MKAVPVSRARKLKSRKWLVNSKGRHLVVSIQKWGKNWAVTTEDGHFFCVPKEKLLEVER